MTDEINISDDQLPFRYQLAFKMLKLALWGFSPDERMTALMAVLSAEIAQHADTDQEFLTMVDAVPAVIKQWERDET